MTALFITALFIGGLGSLHCIGMCGPLALSLPVIANNNRARFTSTLLYNTGRVVTYTILGAILGLAGNSIAFLGFQQWLSVAMGIAILLLVFLPGNKKQQNNFVQVFFSRLRQNMTDLFSRKKYHSVFFIGILNGLLPCGMVYLAIATAVSTGSILKSSVFMAGFGLGTLPVMWSLSFFGNFIHAGTKMKIKKIYPYVMCVMALLLIVRGLDLDIPVLSPGIEQTGNGTAINCHD